MNKSIIVIDTPSNCKSCMFCGFGGVNLEKYVCCLTREHSESSHLVGCPLRPLPPRKNNNESVMVGSLQMDIGYTFGWNDCLDEITGEKDERKK